MIRSDLGEPNDELVSDSRCLLDELHVVVTEHIDPFVAECLWRL